MSLTHRTYTVRIDGMNYDQATYTARSAQSMGRHRANSYDSTPSHGPELGPLAHIPSPDPDHIDGLHKHAHQVTSSQTPFLPRFRSSPKVSPPSHPRILIRVPYEHRVRRRRHSSVIRTRRLLHYLPCSRRTHPLSPSAPLRPLRNGWPLLRICRCMTRSLLLFMTGEVNLLRGVG